MSQVDSRMCSKGKRISLGPRHFEEELPDPRIISCEASHFKDSISKQLSLLTSTAHPNRDRAQSPVAHSCCWTCHSWPLEKFFNLTRSLNVTLLGCQPQDSQAVEPDLKSKASKTEDQDTVTVINCDCAEVDPKQVDHTIGP